METFTVFCRDDDGHTWIQAIHARDIGQARVEGERQCAADWDCAASDVECFGVAEGDVNILLWED